jgi:membrane-bound lytic murein transglycosylase F
MHHGAASYFLYRGEQMGFEYELALGFAQELGVELDVLTPPPGVELTSWLKAGKGDVLAGLFTNSEENGKTLSVSLSYLETRAQILAGRTAPGIGAVTELAGKTIAVQPDALYAHQLLSSLPPWSLLPVLTKVPSDDGINNAVQAVERGQVTAMLVPELVAEITQRVYPGKLRTIWTIPEPVQLVWAVRPEQTDLLRAINNYLERANRSGLRKMLFDKYFVNAEYLGNSTRMAESTLIAKRLSRYDHLIARHAEEAGFDWRLVAALIFEESRFDNQRVSEAGAYGLMQITPMAAQDMGVKNYTAPRGNIVAGVKYLQSLARQFPHGRPDDRLALMLASYFLGSGHVEDAQRLARQLGYDPHCWEESMERALSLLEDPAYYTQTLYGSTLGSRAVRYVNAIRKRYALYSQYVTRELTSMPPLPLPSPQAASAAG